MGEASQWQPPASSERHAACWGKGSDIQTCVIDDDGNDDE